ncbi:MAG: sulfatase [Verrucomicrobiales bacterium]|nr:sulfatase [Verrucomicrobiales bacterium]
MRLFFLAATLLASGAVISDDRPNILFAFADDWGRYASIYAEESVDGHGTVNDLIWTPNFDAVARNGVLFKNAFVTAPSCTPCRSSILSGQYFYRTGRAAILQGAEWDTERLPSWPLMLRDSGYHIGKVYKVWSPGIPRDAPFGGQEFGFEKAGPNFNAFSQVATKLMREEGKTADDAKAALLQKVGEEFESFLDSRPEDKPFCFWFGPTNVHRKWIKGSGKELWDLDPELLQGKMPDFLPDVPEIREDFADYLGEAMAFDAGLGVLLEVLDARGELENTLVVVSGDHGAPGFPRGKCNLYDFGTNVPLAASWGKGIPAGRVVDDFVNLMDLAPTFLEAGDVEVPEVMTGRSLMPVFESEEDGLVDPNRTWVVTGRERHVAGARTDNLPYPQRALRTQDHLYIVNFKPDRWPMGIPGPVSTGDVPSQEVLENSTFVCFGDLDASPTKAWMIANRNEEEHKANYELGFGKRPERELYLLADDPDQMKNVADDPANAGLVEELHEQLMAELEVTGDPRLSDDPPFEKAPFTDGFQRGGKGKAKAGSKSKGKGKKGGE